MVASSSSGMRHAGRSAKYIFGIWGSIMLISAVASVVGYGLFRHFSAFVTAMTIAVAAGAMLSMLVDTMIPEAFEQQHNFAGLITVAGSSLHLFFPSRVDEHKASSGFTVCNCRDLFVSAAP